MEMEWVDFPCIFIIGNGVFGKESEILGNLCRHRRDHQPFSVQIMSLFILINDIPKYYCLKQQLWPVYPGIGRFKNTSPFVSTSDWLPAVYFPYHLASRHADDTFSSKASNNFRPSLQVVNNEANLCSRFSLSIAFNIRVTCLTSLSSSYLFVDHYPLELDNLGIIRKYHTIPTSRTPVLTPSSPVPQSSLGNEFAVFSYWIETAWQFKNTRPNSCRVAFRCN